MSAVCPRRCWGSTVNINQRSSTFSLDKEERENKSGQRVYIRLAAKRVVS